MEDILSLDDKVLNSIYEDQIPEVRRVPAVLVMKIKKEIIALLECIEADGSYLFRWSHRQLREATVRRYFSASRLVSGIVPSCFPYLILITIKDF